MTYEDAMEVRSYLQRLLAAGINVPPEVLAAAERILHVAGKLYA